MRNIGRQTSIRGELVKAVTRDGLILDGFLVAPRRSRAVLIYIHGLGSNFYRRVDQDLTRKLRRIRTAVLWVNTRGHDIVARINTTAVERRLTIGAERELLSAAHRDLETWVKQARRLGFKRIFLLGHSLGAVKVGLHVKRRQGLQRVVGAIYASPPDMWNENSRAARQSEGLRVAQKMIRRGRGGELMPPGFLRYSQTAESYFDKMSPRRGHNVFNFVRGSFHWARNFRRSQLLIYGDHDEPVKDGDTKTALAAFKRVVPSADVVQIKGADHNYRGKRHIFNDAIVRWLGRVLLSSRNAVI